MKAAFKPLLKYYLKYITKLVLFIHRPTIIAIAGSTNKTFVKDEVSRMLKEKGESVRANPKSFNTEIGLPLAVLNLPSGYNSYKNWLPAVYQSLFCIFQTNFPKFLVLEMGVSQKGDMKYLLSIVKPKVSIITDITQRYLENFSGMDDLAGEYEFLVRKTNSGGICIANGDNRRVKSISKAAGKKAKIEFFGIGGDSFWKAENVKKIETGQTFEITNNGKTKSYGISQFGLHHVYAKMIGVAVENFLSQK